MLARASSEIGLALLPGRRGSASFGSELRRLRERAGLSQEALAERAGLAVNTLAGLEQSRRRRPHPHTIAAVFQALGLTPAERAWLQTLAEAAEPDRTAPPAGAPWSRVCLPSPPTPLIGRDNEVAQAAALLEPTRQQTRLLTLVGPGGIGKTRLALAVAGELMDRYADGVGCVDLAPVRDERLVPASIAHVLGVREAGGRSTRELLLDALRERQVLLLLDNFEHLLGAAPLLAELLEGCARLALLVTSRTALRLRSECRWQVGPLATPDESLPSLGAAAASPAVRLFVERTQVVAPEFVLDGANAAVVAAVCRRLDGMPLAIELAAARAGLLQPAALLQRLERRLLVLTRGAADLPERQQTLRRTLAWSHDLLGAVEQVLFRRLAVFAGGWTLEAAEAVCADRELPREELLERLEILVDNSLVRREGGELGESRFGMLETIREYAEERLADAGELELIRTRHRDFYVAYAERAAPELTGPNQHLWFGRLTQELDNFRAARAWSRRDPAGGEVGLRLAAALSRYLWVRAPGSEGRTWLSEALSGGPTGPTAARAQALTFCGQLDHLHGADTDGRARLEEAVAIARVLNDAGLLCLTLRILALFSADPSEARSLVEEAVEHGRLAGDQRELSFALSFLARACERQGDAPGAYERCTQAVVAAHASGDAVAQAEAQLRLAGCWRPAATTRPHSRC